jgi:hypothetical protein
MTIYGAFDVAPMCELLVILLVMDESGGGDRSSSSWHRRLCPPEHGNIHTNKMLGVHGIAQFEEISKYFEILSYNVLPSCLAQNGSFFAFRSFNSRR